MKGTVNFHLKHLGGPTEVQLVLSMGGRVMGVRGMGLGCCTLNLLKFNNWSGLEKYFNE